MLSVGPNLVPGVFKGLVNFFFGSFELGRIAEILVKTFCRRCRNKRAIFVSVITDGNDVVPGDALVFIHVVRGVSRNINMVFFHNRNRSWVEPVCFDSCTVDSGFAFKHLG